MRAISESTMSQLSAFLGREMGLNYPKERWKDLEKGIALAAREFGFDDLQQCVQWLMSAPLDRKKIETLASYLTVGETYFYRDPKMLEIIERRILPALVQTRRGKEQRLRIWSAGCSTGEEPYSIAILLHRVLHDISDWNITILATDINHTALNKGRSGNFGRWSFRDTPSWFKHFFTAQPEERMRIVEPVRRMVSFEYLNLAEDSYPSLFTNTNAMDLILCRNVLMYFAAETARKVIARFNRCLVENGWLVVGAAETAPKGYRGFQSAVLDGATCYRKTAKPAVPQQLPAHAKEPATHEKEPQPQLTEPVALGGEVRRADEVAARAGEAVAGRAGEAVAGPAEGQAPALQVEVAPSAAPAVPEAPPAAAAPPPDALPEAEELFRRGLYQQASGLLEEIRQNGEVPAEALILLVRSHANLGKLDEALAVCDEALKERKLDPALHYLRAEILQERGTMVEAQLALQRALYLDPDSVLAHFALGNLLLSGGKQERARKEFQNALALLERMAPDQVISGSDGMTAGRLREVIEPMSGASNKAQGGRP